MSLLDHLIGLFEMKCNYYYLRYRYHLLHNGHKRIVKRFCYSTVFHTDGLCHTRWFSFGHYGKTCVVYQENYIKQ